MRSQASAAYLPHGTVTFALLSIVGTGAARRYDAVVQTATGHHKGHIFEASSAGWSIVFHRADAAIAAVTEVLLAIPPRLRSDPQRLDLRVALHTGLAEEGDGRYASPAQRRARNLLAIAPEHGVLVSGPTAALVHGALPPGTRLDDLGKHQLFDLTAIEHVFTLAMADAVAANPVLRSLDRFPTNLPCLATSFVARDDDVAAVIALLESHFLVTITGVSGIGKTRLALHAGAREIEHFSDGVWLMDCGRLSSADGFARALARRLDMDLPAVGPAVDHLVRALAAKYTCLVIDRCDHLRDQIAEVFRALALGAPGVRLVATASQPLALEGEAHYVLGALPLNGLASGARVRDAEHAPSVMLFAERASGSDRRFSLTPDNVDDVVAICALLRGNPLALELIAAHVATIGVHELRSRLDERFYILGARERLDAADVLREAITLSFALLDMHERTTLRRLATFADGFDIEGAVAVAQTETLTDFDIFNALASLIAKALVVAEPGTESVRHRLLPPIRAFAAARLREAGEADACGAREVRLLCERFTAARDGFDRTARNSAIEALLAGELVNVRAALDSAAARADARTVADLLAAIGATWSDFALGREGIERIERVLPDLPAHADDTRAQLFVALAGMHRADRHTTEAIGAAREAVAAARLGGDSATLGWALVTLGRTLHDVGSTHESDAVLTQAGAVPEIPRALRPLLLLGQAANSEARGDFARTAGLIDRVALEYRALGNEAHARSALLAQAERLHGRGETLRSIGIVQNLLPFMRRRGDRLALINAQSNLAGYYLAIDEIDAATVAARIALTTLAERFADATLLAWPLGHFALIHALRRDAIRAAVLTGYADAMIAAGAATIRHTEALSRNRLAVLLHDRLRESELQHLFAEGRQLDARAVTELALDEPGGS